MDIANVHEDLVQNWIWSKLGQGQYFKNYNWCPNPQVLT